MHKEKAMLRELSSGWTVPAIPSALWSSLCMRRRSVTCRSRCSPCTRPSVVYSGMAVYADDPARTEDARVAAQAETDKALAGLERAPPGSRSRSRQSTASSSTN